MPYQYYIVQQPTVPKPDANGYLLLMYDVCVDTVVIHVCHDFVIPGTWMYESAW